MSVIRPKAGERALLRTRRLLMRSPAWADSDAIVSLANDFAVARMLGRLPHPYAAADARMFLDKIVPSELVWAITLTVPPVYCEAAPGELIGIVGLGPREGGGFAELGYWLGRRFWGSGFATEAAAAVVHHAFLTLAMPALTSAHFEDNAASARVLRKLGSVETRRGERPCLAAGGMVRAVEMRLEPAFWQPRRVVARKQERPPDGR